MTVKIITDSAADLPLEYAEANGITVIPMKIMFGDKMYRDRVDIDNETFYEKLESEKETPTTTQITPYEFTQEIEKLGSDDTAVVITISSKHSGSHSALLVAAEAHRDKIFPVDSENASVGERILVEYALMLRDKGLGAKEIADELNRRKKDVRVIARMDTLEYLKRGGRISKTAAAAGSILSIKPIIAVENGEIVFKGKARGLKHADNLLDELIEKTGGIDFSMPYALGFTGKDDTLLTGYIENAKRIWQSHTDKLPVTAIGSLIGTHAGPGAVAVAFFSK
jgi:DegV family protein with EDD domain